MNGLFNGLRMFHPKARFINTHFHHASLSVVKCANEISTAKTQNSLLFQRGDKNPNMSSIHLFIIHNDFSKILFQTIGLYIITFATLS